MSNDEKTPSAPKATETEPARRKMVRPPTGGTAQGRGMGTQIKTADKKSMSSIQWIKRQLADPWSEKARAEGWRSRAAFKFSEIDDRFHLVKKGSRVIDLGAAPGGWVQVCVNRGAGAVVGVDLLPIEPIPGSTLIQADFTDPGVDQQLIDALGGPPDLVLSDMAHNTVGHRQTDHLKIIALIEIAAGLRHPDPAAGRGLRDQEFPGRRRRPGAGRPPRQLPGREVRQARGQPEGLVGGLSGGAEQAVGRWARRQFGKPSPNRRRSAPPPGRRSLGGSVAGRGAAGPVGADRAAGAGLAGQSLARGRRRAAEVRGRPA
jgi:23S rRNA (uridine2552-2'-O)-methyltransferase